MRLFMPLALAGLLAACQGVPVVGQKGAAERSASPLNVAAPTARPDATLTVGDWGQLEGLPTPRSEVAAVAYAGTIFVIGGLGGARSVERYVPISRIWRREPDLPVGLDHAMAAAVQEGTGTGVYVIGGNADGRPTARVFHLAPGADRWREIEPMPSARAAGVAVTIGRRIYVAAGVSAPDTLERAVHAYDLDQKRWQGVADIPTPRDHAAGVAVRDRMCIVGGRTLSMVRNLGTLECFDVAAGRWEKRASLPTPRGGLGAAALGERIVVIGGEQPQGTFKEVEVYDLRSDSWTRGSDLRHPRHGLGVVAIDRLIYAIAGGTRPGGGSETGIVEYWNLP